MNDKEGLMSMNRPPLGPKPDFDKLDKERYEKAAKLEYISINNYPEILQTLQIASNEIGHMRQEFGLTEIPFESSKVRLIKKDIWDNNPSITRPDSEAGFIDQNNRISFVKLEQEDLDNNLVAKINALHTATHEYVHSGMDAGISEYSFYINEGITDLITKRILNKVLSSIRPDNDPEKYINFAQSHKIEELELHPDDLLLIEDDKVLAWYPYITQMRLLEALENGHPGILQQLIKAAFTGDSKGAENIITAAYGDRVSKIITSRFLTAKTMIDEIEISLKDGFKT